MAGKRDARHAWPAHRPGKKRGAGDKLGRLLPHHVLLSHFQPTHLLDVPLELMESARDCRSPTRAGLDLFSVKA